MRVNDINFYFSAHAKRRMKQRKINPEEVRRVLEHNLNHTKYKHWGVVRHVLAYQDIKIVIHGRRIVTIIKKAS